MDKHQKSTPASTATNPSKKHNVQHPILIAIITLLILVIIGTIIAIIMTANRNKQVNIYDSALNTNQSIQDTFRENGNVDELISSYQTAINNAITSQDYVTAAALINYRSDTLISINYCDKAIEILENTDLTGFDTDSTAKFYSDAMGIGIDCDREDLYNTWYENFSKLNEDSQL